MVSSLSWLTEKSKGMVGYITFLSKSRYYSTDGKEALFDHFWDPEHSLGTWHVHLPPLKGTVLVMILLLFYMKHSWETMVQFSSPGTN